MADNQKKVDRKVQKARKKAQKNNKIVNNTNEEEQEDEGGSKLAVFFVTFIIITIWMAILVLLIKWDVGGFGSTVMTPILKNVPYVNRILPESDELVDTETEYPYQTLDEAVAYIKELELELQDAQQGNSDNEAQLSELEAEAEKLKEYEADESAFEDEKQKFYEEVVFSDEAPDISEYKKYYESIEPANAEQLYKQVVEQTQADAEIEEYVNTYSQMKPKQAAAIFDTMTDNLELVAKILENMAVDARGDILGNMNADTAAKVTEIMEPSE